MEKARVLEISFWRERRILRGDARSNIPPISNPKNPKFLLFLDQLLRRDLDYGEGG